METSAGEMRGTYNVITDSIQVYIKVEMNLHAILFVLYKQNMRQKSINYLIFIIYYK